MLRRDLTSLFREVPSARGESTSFAVILRPGKSWQHGVTWNARFGQPVITRIKHNACAACNIEPHVQIEDIIVSMLLEAGMVDRVGYAQSVVPDIYLDLSTDLWRENQHPFALVVPESWASQNRTMDWLTFAAQCGLDSVFISPRLDAKTLIAVADPDALGTIVTSPSGRGIIIPNARAVAVRTLPPLTLWDKLMSGAVA